MPYVLALEWADILLGGVAACAILGCGSINGPSHSATGGAGREISIPVGSYNQCETDLTANGHTFHGGLLDSGASGHLTFGSNHAKALGFDAESLSYSGSFESANGTGRYAHVKLRELKIGNWSLRDVPAEITQATQSAPIVGLEILHVLNFHLSGGYCHLELPGRSVAASMHPSPSVPLRTDIQPAPVPTYTPPPRPDGYRPRVGQGTGGLY
jgi:clan AA aspartic protease (TIGR02281 family)